MPRISLKARLGGVYMRKLTLIGVTILIVLSLAACSNKTSENTISKESTSKLSPITKEEKTDNSKFNSVISDIKSQLDPKSEGGWNYKITNDVTNEYISKGTIIEVRPTYKSGAENLKKIYDDANSGNTDSQVAKLALQNIISDTAKKLPDDNSEITLGYSIDSDNSVLLAASTKEKDIIPLD